MNGTATVIYGTDEDREAVQVLKRSASNQDVPPEMLGTTITISKNNSSPVSSISSPRSSRTDMESVADISYPRDSPNAQNSSRLRRSSMQRQQMIRQQGGVGQGAICRSDQSIIKMENVLQKAMTQSQNSTEDNNAKPGSASSAQRSPVVEITESVDRELDGERETEGGVNVTSRSWGKISTPQISAVDDELRRIPALCDKAWPASSGVHTAIILNTEEEPHPCPYIADEESDIDLGNAGQEQQQDSRRGDLTISGKHDKISRQQSSSGISLSYSTTPFVEGCRSTEVAPKTRLRLRFARAVKSVQVEALRRHRNCDKTAFS